jgi:hypothetical protein
MQEMEFLLLNTIILDTCNFDKNLYKNRWQDLDLEMAHFLNNQNHSFDQLYNNLTQQKFSKELNMNLQLNDLINKDTKIYSY